MTREIHKPKFDRPLPDYMDYIQDRNRWSIFKKYRFIEKEIKSLNPGIDAVAMIKLIRELLPLERS